ncbi:aminotransferase class IV family protein [Comamonas testosteroni]|uniref:aminotransferase class IV family protein n=1 Tax=Comamonas testosteroni TaxID=285 RepID=UPI00265E4ED9|nr:aminotransferase class IV family protein [Comamonas testosteroni]WKL18643.1 aminotransferase class IV family protein [Comamonas testosteroni]
MSNRPSNAATVQRNGRPATAEALGPLAFAGYAHFTALQVRDGKVRGLDLHLQRLHAASLTMFGCALTDEAIKSYLASALKTRNGGDFSLTATLYSSAGEFTPPGNDAPLHMLVRTSPPSDGPQGPLVLDIVNYERVVPEIKHVGEIAKTWFQRKAVEHGFDDAAFIDKQGRLSEGSIWNLVFWDGKSVVWPKAKMLRGTTMAIVMRQLKRLGVPQRFEEITIDSLTALQGAAVMNSWTPAVEVRRLGSANLPSVPDFLELLHRAFESEPLTAV